MGKSIKRSNQVKGASKAKVAQLKRAQEPDENEDAQAGLLHGKTIEAVPNLYRAQCEKIISGENNTFIRLTRDGIGPPLDIKKGGKVKQYGAIGATAAGAIDIVAGVSSAEVEEEDDNEDSVRTTTSVSADASRLYLSQKCNVDHLFNLSSGKFGKSEAKAAAVMKSDAVRIIARENIKLVTGTDANLSPGAESQAVKGIEIIAGNNRSGLQPIVKGKNLVNALDEIFEHIDNLTGIVINTLKYQMDFNSEVQKHTHLGFMNYPTLPSVPVMTAGQICDAKHIVNSLISLELHRAEGQILKNKYLEQYGEKYINSRYNYSN
jgi:hypothetical protein